MTIDQSPRCECRIETDLCPDEGVWQCYVCGDAICEDCSKLVSLREEGYVRICRCEAPGFVNSCGYAIDQRRLFPVRQPDATSWRAVKR